MSLNQVFDKFTQLLTQFSTKLTKLKLSLEKPSKNPLSLFKLLKI